MSRLFSVDIDPKRVYGLDLLRAAAILFVIIGHGGHYLPAEWLKVNSFLAFDGVSLFFVLSGFLIGGIFIRMMDGRKVEGRDILEFWMRRWLRTLPAYLFILTVLIILKLSFGEPGPTKYLLKYFLFIQNLYYGHPWFFPEAWSLSVEEWFYLLTPIIVLLVLRITGASFRQALLWVSVALIVSITAFRLWRFSLIDVPDIETWDMAFRKPVITRLDSLMFGMIGAYIRYYSAELWEKRSLLFFLVGCLILVAVQIISVFGLLPVNGIFSCVFSFTAVSLGTLLMLPFLNALKNGHGRVYSAVTVISLISYSMYLTNMSLVQGWIIESLHISSLGAKYLLFWLLTITLSILMYKYIERPMMALREHPLIRERLSRA